MKHFFVVNPHCFRIVGQMEQVISEIVDCFYSLDSDDYDIHFSRYPRDAVTAIYKYIKNTPAEEKVRVYAVGGDGTLFDCLNGMVDFQNAELTSVPYGNSNTFMRVFGEKSLTEFRDLKKLTQGQSLLLDLIDCGSNCVVNELGIGLEGEAVHRANVYFRSLLSKSKYTRLVNRHIYTIFAFLGLFNKRVMNQHYNLLVDGVDMSGRYYNIAIANGPCNGGTMTPSPYAKPDSGVLDVIFGAATGNALRAMITITDYTNGHFEKHKLYSRVEARKLEIKSEEPISVHLDGEAFYTNYLEVKIVPQGMRFFVPEGVELQDFSHIAYKNKRA